MIKLLYFLKKHIKKVVMFSSVFLTVGLCFFFRKNIYPIGLKTYEKTKNFFFANIQKTKIKKEDDVNNFEEKKVINVITVSSLPYTEKVQSAGVTFRDSIKIMSDGFKEIVYIVEKDKTEVKKGEILVKYNVRELELRSERLKADLKIKTEILERAKKMDKENIISKDELDKLQIDVLNTSGELKEINYRISESTKVAPFDCFIKHHGLINGSFVNNGQEIITIFQKEKLFVKTNISLKDINGLKEKDLSNKKVKLKFSNSKSFDGQVIYFLNNADPFTASISVVIEVFDKKKEIAVGEVCKLKIYTGSIERLFLIPEEAICGEDYDFHVFVIKKNIAYKVPIMKHKKKDDCIFISGICAGDVIAVNGAHRLVNLSKVSYD